jgi:hypothetical protein
MDETDQLLLVRNVGLDADGYLCKASRNLATALKFPHHVEAKNLHHDLAEILVFSLFCSLSLSSNCNNQTHF